MAISKMKAEFECDVKKIWDIVTSLENYSWRSDLSQIKILDNGKQFVEYTRDGYATKFKITVYQSCKRYEFDMENENMTGHWIGIFSSQNNKTTIEFIENVQVKKILMRPFIKMYLKKQQRQYIHDLTTECVK